jgi:hypothetical protein
MPRRLLCILLGAALLAVAAAAPSQARFSPKKAIWGPGYVSGVSQFPRYRELGVGIYQAQVLWAEVATARPRRPRDPRDPAYRWSPELVRDVAEARRNGMRVALMLIGAPRWANGGRPWNWAPRRERDFADFAYAAARRFPGVRLWMIWGEPSRENNFEPLTPAPPTAARLTPTQASAPRRYARLLDAAYAALKGASRSNRVIGGMTYTTGDISTWNWIRYMRLPNGRPPRLDLYGHNPFTWRRPSLGAPPSCCGSADFSDLGRLAPQIDRNFNPPRSRRRIPFFLSEFFLPTDVDRELNFHVDRATQASWISGIMRIVRSWSRIQAFGWVHLYDEPPSPTGERVGHGGLLEFDGRPKPGYFAFGAG